LPPRGIEIKMSVPDLIAHRLSPSAGIESSAVAMVERCQSSLMRVLLRATGGKHVVETLFFRYDPSGSWRRNGKNGVKAESEPVHWDSH
jgi:hypothetical protein